LIGLAIVSASLSVANAGIAVASGQQSCAVNDACASSYASGAVYNGWAGNDTDYSNDFFNNGTTVNDNVGYGRDRNSTYTLLCFYYDPWWGGGSSGSAPYAGATWVLVGRSSSSHWLRVQSFC
jgi:hypothetical protein